MTTTSTTPMPRELTYPEILDILFRPSPTALAGWSPAENTQKEPVLLPQTPTPTQTPTQTPTPTPTPTPVFYNDITPNAAVCFEAILQVDENFNYVSTIASKHYPDQEDLGLVKQQQQ